MFRRDRGDDFWCLDTHSLRKVAQSVSRWRSAVPQGRICVTQWSCSCLGVGPQCLRDAFASHSGAFRVPVEVRSASGTHLRHTVELFVSRSAVPQGRICVTQWSCSCPGGGPQCLRDAFASHSGAVRVPVVVRSASGTHLRHTVELFVSRWRSAVPQGREMYGYFSGFTNSLASA